MDRFLRIVAPLVVAPQSEIHTNDIGSWGQSDEADEDRRFRLKEIFEAALALKAATVTTDHALEFVLHPPGTPSNGRDTSLGAGDDTWMVASFHVYRGEKQISGNTLADAIVKCRNFVVKSQQRRKDSTEYQKVLMLQRQDEVANLDEHVSKGRLYHTSIMTPNLTTLYQILVTVSRPEGPEIGPETRIPHI